MNGMLDKRILEVDFDNNATASTVNELLHIAHREFGRVLEYEVQVDGLDVVADLDAWIEKKNGYVCVCVAGAVRLYCSDNPFTLPWWPIPSGMRLLNDLRVLGLIDVSNPTRVERGWEKVKALGLNIPDMQAYTTGRAIDDPMIMMSYLDDYVTMNEEYL